MTIVNPHLSLADKVPPKHPKQETSRKFHNFLTAFEEFGKDNFTPPIFNTWTGISIIAGALERKVWLEWNQSLRYYPNLYVMLVGLPGSGKTTAINRGVSIMSELYKANRLVNFLPTQVTEAKLIELMGQKATFYYEGQPYTHCSGYYFASEASDSFKEIYGDITSTMTNFYDCPNFWEKATKKDGRLTIQNACFNILGGSTLQYLNELVNQNNVMGGFASRLNYVICRDNNVKRNSFPTENKQVAQAAMAYRDQLVSDLKRINEMIGPFSTTQEFREAWEEWDFKVQTEKKGQSEQMQSLAVRTGTSMHKLCMVLSAAESSDRVMKLPHFLQARTLLEQTQSELPKIFREARANNVGTADGLQNALCVVLAEGPVSKMELARKLSLRGFDPTKVDSALKSYIANGLISVLPDGKLKLLVDSY